MKSKVYRSQKKNEQPHKLQLLMSADSPTKLLSHSCSCTAGNGFCQHIIAVLYQAAHYKMLGLKSVPPIVSKTSAPQQWHVPPRTHGIKRRPISEMTIMKVVKPSKKRKQSGSDLQSKPKRRKVSEGIRSTLYNPVTAPLDQLNFIQAMTQTLQLEQHKPLFMHLTGNKEPLTFVDSKFGQVPKGSILSYQTAPEKTNHDGCIINVNDAPTVPKLEHLDLPLHFHGPLSEEDQNYFDGLCVTEQQAHEYEELTRSQSQCPEWHRLRENRITASNFKRVTGRQKEHSKLANDMLNKRTIQTAAMKHGIECEDDAAKLYAEKNFVNVYPVGIVINPSAVHIACSPDRRVYDPAETPPWGLLEVKCPVKNSFTEVDYLKQDPRTLKYELKKNHAYYVQVMGQMGVTGSKWCDFFVWTEHDYHVERIYFKEDEFRDIKSKLDVFYFTWFLPALSAKKTV